MHSPRLFASALALAVLAGCTPSGGPPAPREVVTRPAVAPVTPEPARPALPPPTDLARLNAALAGCTAIDESYPLGPATRLEELGPWGGERVFMARMTTDPAQRVLLFDSRESQCPAFVVRPATTTRGDFFGEGTPRTAVLLSQSGDDVLCNSDACPVALYVRDEADVVLSAVRPDAECTTFTLKTVRLFADRDSIELRCVTGVSDELHTVHLLHAFDRSLKSVLSFASSRTTSAPADGDRICYRSATRGGYTIKTRGAVPVVRVVDVFADFDFADGPDPHEGTRGDWTFSAAEQRLVPGKLEKLKKLPGSRSFCESL